MMINKIGHLCVSNAMKDFLINTWHVKGNVSVLHDKPPSHYKKLSIAEIHSVIIPFS